MTDIASIAVGNSNSCAMRESGEILCWGSNWGGQIGNREVAGIGIESVGTPTTVLWPGIGDVEELTLGGAHMCAQSLAGTVQCWGYNANGELGNGSTFPPFPAPGTPEAGPALVSSVVDLAAGGRHTCAVLEDRTVVCWGASARGETGRGGAPQLIPRAVDGLANVDDVAAGWNHSCALTSSGSVLCWGANHRGQLGDMTRLDRAEPARVPLPAPAHDLALGCDSSCALLDGDEIWCWGDSFGTTRADGIPRRMVALPNVVKIGEACQSGCALQGSGQVTCWGGYMFRAPHLIEGLTHVVDIGVGGRDRGLSHVCALRSSGEVLCWGGNGDGELGDDCATDFRDTPAPVVGLP